MYRSLATFVVCAGIVGSGGAAYSHPLSAIFPLGEEWAGDRELPSPIGVGMTYHYQKQDYDLVSLQVMLPGLGPVEGADLMVQNKLDEYNLKVDLWLLPFVNIYGLLGKIDGVTTVELDPPFNEFKIEYGGLVYGGGMTLAVGSKRFFGSVTGVYTQTGVDLSDSSVRVWVVSPRIGIHGRRGACWVGSMYQEADERQRGTATLPVIGDVDFDVELDEKEPWNYLAGLTTGFRKHWNVELEGSVGNRKQVTILLTYRL